MALQSDSSLSSKHPFWLLSVLKTSQDPPEFSVILIFSLYFLMLNILVSCRIQQRRLPGNTACSRQSHYVAPCSQRNTQHVQESQCTAAEIPIWAPCPGPVLSDPPEWVPSAPHAQLHLYWAHSHQFHFTGEGEETEGSSVYSGKCRAMGRLLMKCLEWDWSPSRWEDSSASWVNWKSQVLSYFYPACSLGTPISC